MDVITVPRYGDTLKEKLYLPAIVSGMGVTIKHFAKNLSDTSNIQTVLYPEIDPSDITTRYRGLHRLTHRDDDGSIRCVACFMCATACPAGCINIVATQREDGVDEKMPEVFNIDLLECVYCGYCVEACPCDAIRMDTGIFTFIATKRDDFVIDKDSLLDRKGMTDV
jgi:NADH-quinone oxidoreductase subunit I